MCKDVTDVTVPEMGPEEKLVHFQISSDMFMKTPVYDYVDRAYFGVLSPWLVVERPPVEVEGGKIELLVRDEVEDGKDYMAEAGLSDSIAFGGDGPMDAIAIMVTTLFKHAAIDAVSKPEEVEGPEDGVLAIERAVAAKVFYRQLNEEEAHASGQEAVLSVRLRFKMGRVAR